MHSPLSRVAACLLALSGPAGALTLEFVAPAQQTALRAEGLTSYRMPVGPFDGDAVQTLLIEGPLDQRAWRLDAPDLTTLQLLAPLRDQVTAGGFTVIYECEAARCGGFDFRYGTEVLPEPDMHVDLGDFRYLAAQRRTAQGQDYLSLIVSRTDDQGFVQVTRVGGVARAVGPAAQIAPLGRAGQALPPVQPGGPPVANAPVQTTPGSPPGTAEGITEGITAGTASGTLSGTLSGTASGTALAGALAERLVAGGAQVLPDLVFASGSAVLSGGSNASLTELAGFLTAFPQAVVVLVGHTDASGGLDANIALSRQRAQSVRARMLADFDIPPRQIEAEGVGYLSPRAPNDTEAGRLANRRVEVMLRVMGTE